MIYQQLSGIHLKLLALVEDRPTPGETLSVESQKGSSQIPAGHVREGLSSVSKLRGDGAIR